MIESLFLELVRGVGSGIFRWLVDTPAAPPPACPACVCEAPPPPACPASLEVHFELKVILAVSFGLGLFVAGIACGRSCCRRRPRKAAVDDRRILLNAGHRAGRQGAGAVQ